MLASLLLANLLLNPAPSQLTVPQPPPPPAQPLLDFATPALTPQGDPQDQTTEILPDGTLRITVAQAKPQRWDVALNTPAFTTPIQSGDYIYATWQARCLGSEHRGVGFFQAFGQLNQAPWTGWGSTAARVGPEWQNFALLAQARRDWQPGTAMVAFHLANRRQTLEFREFRAYNLGSAIPQGFQRVPATYPGREPNAPWRAKAAQMIDQHRKADLEITVKNPQGRPVPNAQIHIKTTRNAYAFGSFTDYEAGRPGPQGDRYRAEMKRLFNRVTIPMYWADWGWESASEIQNYFRIAHWAKKENFRIKAHVAIYPGWNFLPTRLRALENDPAKLENEIKVHLVEKLEATRQFNIENWDVTNELRDLPELQLIFGDRIYADMFKLAKATDPKPLLYLNENSIITNGLEGNPNIETYENHIKSLLAQNAPLEGIGIQGHFGEFLVGMDEVWAILDRFAAFKLPIEITEFDINTTDEQLQADYTRDLLTAFYAHPATTGFTIWGFWEGSIWIKEAAMLRQDWSPKPNAKVWENLVLREFLTDKTFTTDSNGQSRLRATQGETRVTVRHQNLIAETTIHIKPGQNQAEIKLP